jgi:hypothetical protein
VGGLIAAPELRSAFPTLVVDGATDFHHFWFYSGLAAAIARLVGLVGASVTAPGAFLALHVALLAILFGVAHRAYGVRGLFTAALLTVASPAIWFIDKVHTEHFTFCLTTCAVIAFSRRWYALACLALAVVSTQNPSFAGIAIVVAVIGALRARRRTWRGGLVVSLAAVLILVHPLYYLSRYGALSPQLYTGGAILFAARRFAWIWFVDPDVGLFPSWWLGVILLGAAVAALRRRSGRSSRVAWFVFVGAWLAAFGVSRYATWYLALFFPPLLALVTRLRGRPAYRAAFAGLAVAACAHAWAFFRPTLDESGYGRPTPLSYAIQRHAPWAYDPPAEIFAERFGGVGESFDQLGAAMAIVGPDCRKTLLLKPGSGTVLAPPACGDVAGRRELAVLAAQEAPLPRYVRLARLGSDLSDGPRAVARSRP